MSNAQKYLFTINDLRVNNFQTGFSIGAAIFCAAMKYMLCLLIAATITSSIAQSVQQPLNEKRYTLQEVFANRFDLDGQIVKIDVTFTKVAPEQVSKDEWRIFCKSSPGIASAYEYVYIGRDGAAKILGKNSAPSGYQGYAMVTPDKITLIGRSARKGTDGKVAEYTW